MRQLLVTASLAALLVLAVVGAQAQPKALTVVGTPVCMTCHHTYAEQWAKLAHSQAMLTESLPPEKRGCEACHGPGSAHIGPDRKAVVAWDQIDVEQQSKLCLQCHASQGLTEALWSGGPHSLLMGCPECHEVHRPTERSALLKKDEGQDCAPCHDDIPELAAKGEHHSLGEGALTCDQCHAFHGSEHPALLRQAKAELCKGCHGDDVPQPASHEKTDFRLKHGDDARGQEPACLRCHDQQQFCDQCHSVKYPHPEEFALEHKAEAEAKPSACLACHQADYCGQCHEPLPPPFDKLAAEQAAQGKAKP